MGHRHDDPGIPKLVTSNDAEANSLSCTSAGTCVAAGYYDDDDGSQGYVYELPTVPGGALQSVTPARILETRTGPNDKTEDGKFQGIGPRDAMSTTEFTVADRGGVPGNADAVMLNVTAIAPDAAGFLTVWPCTLPRPVASNVNYGPGDVAPNAVLAKLSNTGTVCIYTRAATDLIVDVNGYVS